MTKLIAIEGPDKVGKATQSRLLADALGGGVEEIPYNDGKIYDQIYSMLEDGSAVSMPQAFQAFQSANRFVFQDQALWRCPHDFLVLDRWDISSWVYGRVSGLPEEVLNTILAKGKKADFVIILDGDPMGEPEDSYERNVEFMHNVRRGYLQWARENGAPVVDANRSREVVHADILSHVKAFFPEVDP